MALGALTIRISQPLAVGTGILTQITDEIQAYNHTIDVEGGYATCKFEIAGNQRIADDYLYDYLGAHVECFAPDGVKIWEGFINTVDMNIGGLKVTRGPMLDVANSLWVKYQTPSYNFSSAGITIGGDQSITSEVSDVPSQNKYGIREKMISAGTASDTEAVQIANSYLNENLEAPMKQDLSFGGSTGSIRLTVNCMGYREMLDYFPSNNASGDGTMNLSDKLETLITADPNSIFPTTYNNVTSNTTQVAKYWEEDQVAKAIVKGLVALGGPSPDYDRYIWGIYDDRDIFYEPVVQANEYTMSLTDSGQRILDSAGIEVPFYDVRPGTYILVADFQIGRVTPDKWAIDPRMLFIESVSYSAPDSLKLNGGRVDTIPQKLARLNLGGL